jgi:hypothetical protein
VAQELESALSRDDDDDHGSPTPAPDATLRHDPGLVDPHYEDLWVSGDTAAMNIADIPAMDIDFDDHEGEGGAAPGDDKS